MHVIAAVTLRTGPLSVVDYRCTAGPADTPYTEEHQDFSVSYVRQGTFSCRTRGATYDLVAGSVLVGRPGDEFLCAHDHGQGGDRCLSFQLAPELVESLSRRTGDWRSTALPPRPELIPLGELAWSAIDGISTIGVDEVGLLFAAGVAEVLSDSGRERRRLPPRDRRRAVETAQWIDENRDQHVDLAAAAAHAGLSPFHFLRLFTDTVGVTPHQYVVRSRLRRAAWLLADDGHSVTEVAFSVGFGDLSNFTRTFRCAAGLSPRQFRRAARGDRKILQDLTARLSLPSQQ